jgi:stage III sporulation protein AH
MLQDTLSSEGAEETAKQDAGAAIETLAASTVSEAQIENLVVAKGYADCISFISDAGVSVVVSATENGLQSADVARITEIVTGETGVPASQITIIEAQG